MTEKSAPAMAKIVPPFSEYGLNCLWVGDIARGREERVSELRRGRREIPQNALAVGYINCGEWVAS
jgi:hypothetical protein